MRSHACVKASLLVIALAGCNLAQQQTLEPSQVVTGIYEMNATTQTDTCDPPRFVGSALTSIYADSSVITFTDQSSSSNVQRYELESAEGYTARVPPLGSTITLCPDGTGSVELDYTLTAADATAFTVTDDETWTIASLCANASVGGSTVPVASCSAERSLVFTLVQACAPPCEVLDVGTTPTPTCSCQGGSATGSGSSSP